MKLLALLILLSPGAALAQAEPARAQTARPPQPPAATARRWVGGARMGADWMYMVLQGDIAAGRVTGAVSVRQLGIVQKPIKTGTLKGRALRLVVPAADDAPLIISGTKADGRIYGAVRKGGLSGEFQLRLVGVADEQALVSLAGEYRAPSGSLIYIAREGGALRYVDVQTGSRGWLFPSPQSDTTFVRLLPLGAETLAPTPIVTVTFERAQNAHATGLRWAEGGRPTVLATFDPVRREEVTYAGAGGVSIAGSLYLPKGPAPHPAIIISEGSGPTTRGFDFVWMARFFTEQGFAALITDKRGAGASTGSYDSATYQDFADDISAGLRFLRGRKDIKREAIGMWGHSEGAWIAPMATARAPEDVAFVVLSAALGVPPWQQELFLTEHLLRAEDYSEAEVADALSLRGLMFQVIAANGKGWEEFRAEVDRHRRARWLERLIDTTDDKQQFLTRNRDLFHDPEPSLRRLRGPVLALIGECDHIVPAQESRVALAQVFAASGIDYTIRVVPNMGHGLQDECGDTDRRAFSVRGYSTEYLNTLRQWLRQNSKVVAPPR